jgi:hypothetical protein
MLGAGEMTIHGPPPEEKTKMERWLELTLQDDDKIWINMVQVVGIEPRGPTDTRIYTSDRKTYRVKEVPADLVIPYDDE